MGLVNNFAERIRLLRRRIQQLTAERDRLDREIQESVDLLNNYMAVWDAERDPLRGPDAINIDNEARGPVRAGNGAASAGVQTPEDRPDAPRSVFQMVMEVLEGNDDPLHVKDITERVRQVYPTTAARAADLPRQVGVALVRGKKRGVVERIAPNTFRVKK